MESKAFALWTGLFMLLLVSALAVTVAWMSGARQGDRVAYTVVSSQSVSGLNREAAVQYRGIPVGKVVALAIDPSHPRLVRIQLDVDVAVKLSPQAWARLGTQGLTGLTFVELHDDGGPPWRNPAGAPLPMRPSLWQDTTNKLPAVLGEARLLGERLNAVLDERNRRELAELLVNLNRLSAQLPALGEQSVATLAASRALVNELRQLAQTSRNVLTQTAPQWQGAAARLNQDTLPQLGQLALHAEQTAQALDTLIDNQTRHPQQLLLGVPASRPGPGEAGFTPSGAPQ